MFAEGQWLSLVRRIQADDPSGMEELYRVFSKGVRFYLVRHLGPQELEDRIHDTFLTVVHAIRRGELREPDRLMGFVRTVVRRQVAAHIEEAVQVRRDHLDLEQGVSVADTNIDPEEGILRQERARFMTEVLGSLSARDREVLERFYLREQSQEQICDEMQLSDTQFRLLKSRAKARFGDLGRRKILQRPLNTLFVRKKSSPRH